MTQPVEDFCWNCGTAVAAFPPDTDKQQLITEAKADERKMAVLKNLSEVVAGRIPTNFSQDLVVTEHILGQKIDYTVLAVDNDDFVNHFGVHPDKTPGQTLEKRPISWYDRNANPHRGVVFSDAAQIPPTLKTFPVELFHIVQTKLVEYHLKPEKHFRAPQSLEVWKWSAQQIAKHSGDALQFENLRKALSYDEWKKKCEEVEEARKQREQLMNQAGAALGLAPPAAPAQSGPKNLLDSDAAGMWGLPAAPSTQRGGRAALDVRQPGKVAAARSVGPQGSSRAAGGRVGRGGATPRTPAFKAERAASAPPRSAKTPSKPMKMEMSDKAGNEVRFDVDAAAGAGGTTPQSTEKRPQKREMQELIPENWFWGKGDKRILEPVLD